MESELEKTDFPPYIQQGIQLFYKTMEKIHYIEHHVTLMVTEVSKQIQSLDTLHPSPQSGHNHHFKIQFI
jgi:hypothetical protein